MTLELPARAPADTLASTVILAPHTHHSVWLCHKSLTTLPYLLLAAWNEKASAFRSFLFWPP